MSDLTVADILAARPSLQQRAVEARKRQVEAEAREAEAERERVRLQLRSWMLDTLDMDESEVADLKYEGAPYSGGPRQSVSVEVDGIRLRARLDTRVIMTRHSSEFGDDVVREERLVVELVQQRGTSVTVTAVESLADIGAKL